MRAKQRYTVKVREYKVNLEFTRINDSRRIRGYDSNKSPNLFGIVCAVRCVVATPIALIPRMRRPHSDTTPAVFQYHGLAYCHWSDKFNAQNGRHRSLKDALRNWSYDDRPLAGEIYLAFLAEEASRTKAKGPATVPRKPRASKPSRFRQLMNVVDKLAEVVHQQSVGEICIVNDPDVGGSRHTATQPVLMRCPFCLTDREAGEFFPDPECPNSEAKIKQFRTDTGGEA